MLRFDHVVIERGGNTVLRISGVETGSPGTLFVVGPGGAGKSSLLKAISGHDQAQTRVASGNLQLNNRDVTSDAVTRVWIAQNHCLADSTDARPQLAQCLEFSDRGLDDWLTHRVGMHATEVGAPCWSKPRLRQLAILAQLERDADLYLVDEPTAGLDDDMLAAVRRRLIEIAERSNVMIATHNRQDCLALGGHTALLAGGVIQECAPTQVFFDAPRTLAARTYVETGNCNLPQRRSGPSTENGTWWLIPGLLAGMSRPGIAAPIDAQCEWLGSKGVRHLVCLEERCPYPAAAMRGRGLAHYHFAVADMAPPSFAQAVDLCRSVEGPIQNNEGIAVHCRGGLGRTGTALAAILIWFGDDAEEAIAKVRRAQPLAIQSLSQFHFLHEFADRIRGWNTPVTPGKENFDVPRQGFGNGTG